MPLCPFCATNFGRRVFENHKEKCQKNPAKDNSPEKKFPRFNSSSCEGDGENIHDVVETNAAELDFSQLHQELSSGCSLDTNEQSSISHSIHQSLTEDSETDDSGPEDQKSAPTTNDVIYDDEESRMFDDFFANNQKTKYLKQKVINWAHLLCILIIFWQLANYVSNAALDSLLFAISHMFHCLADSESDNDVLILKTVANELVPSIYSLHNQVHTEVNITRDIACPKCQSIWSIEDLTDSVTGKMELKCRGTIIAPGRGFNRLPCHENLFRKLRVKSGDKFQPKYIFARTKLISSIQNILRRPDFLQYFEVSSFPPANTERFSDIKDGKVWQNYVSQHCSTGDLFAGFVMNVDWFQPFKKSKLSIGAIYFVFSNLPRSVRFRRENVVLAAVLPYTGHEPESLNGYLRPFVDELLLLHEGVVVTIEGTKRNLKAALLCIGSDLPATKKVLGMLSQAATRGCGFCNLVAKRRANNTYMDYGTGYKDIDLVKMRHATNAWKLPWPKRTVEQHRMVVMDLKRSSTKTARKAVEVNSGLRNTVLLELAYFDTINFQTIDPMHGLFEGIAKKCWGIWLQEKYLTDHRLSIISQRLESIHTPPEMDKLPYEFWISGGMKAIHWCNWVLYYSPLVLAGQLPKVCWDYWLCFVIACRYICQPTITKDDIARYSYWYSRFFKEFCSKHTNFVTPYMHMCLHLEQCVYNFGPISGFWCFTFERYNGILGSYPNNRQYNIELQLMKKFSMFSGVYDQLNIGKNDFNGPFQESLKKIFSEAALTNPNEAKLCLNSIISSHCENLSSINPEFWSTLDYVRSPGNAKVRQLSERELDLLHQCYQYMYHMYNIKLDDLDSNCSKFSRIWIGPDVFTSSGDKFRPDLSIVFANWHPFGESEMKLASVKSFLRHKLQINNETKEHWFAYVVWHVNPVSQAGSIYIDPHSPVQVVSKEFDGMIAASNFLPIQRIANQALSMPDPTATDSYIVVCPILRRFY